MSAAPRRPRSTPFTASRWMCAPRRPRRVVKPSASICTTAVNSSRVEVAERVRAPKTVEQIVLAPFPVRGLGDDLLREDVERLRRHRDPVELAAPR